MAINPNEFSEEYKVIKEIESLKEIGDLEQLAYYDAQRRIRQSVFWSTKQEEETIRCSRKLNSAEIKVIELSEEFPQIPVHPNPVIDNYLIGYTLRRMRVVKY